MIMPRQVHAEYAARKALCRMTRSLKSLVLLIAHGLYLRFALAEFMKTTSDMYSKATVIGTCGESVALYILVGTVKGCAKVE